MYFTTFENDFENKKIKHEICCFEFEKYLNNQNYQPGLFKESSRTEDMVPYKHKSQTEDE